MVNPMATQPSRAASFTLPVTAEQGGWPFESVSLLLSFRMSGICPAYFPATASRKPSGAAYALQPASMASWMWDSGSYPAGLGPKEREGPCSKPWSTGRMTIFPEPASRPWLSMRAMLVLVPGLSEGYQLRISRTRAVNSMSASRSRRAVRLPAASRRVQGTPCPPCREASGRTAPWRGGCGKVGRAPSGRRQGLPAVVAGAPAVHGDSLARVPVRSGDTQGQGDSIASPQVLVHLSGERADLLAAAELRRQIGR